MRNLISLAMLIGICVTGCESGNLPPPKTEADLVSKALTSCEDFCNLFNTQMYGVIKTSDDCFLCECRPVNNWKVSTPLCPK
jgi:hypothetical protein